MSNWKKTRELAVYNNTEPTLTDQSQARETDINVIVGRMGISGTVPGAPGEPMFGDFTNLPTDLRGFIETSREIESLKARLPEQLRGQKVEALLQLTPQAINELLKPATNPTTEDKPE